MGIFKEIKDLEIKSQQKGKKSGIHPFTVVKKEKKVLKIYLYLLVLLTAVVYGGVFYIGFLQEKNEKKSTASKVETINPALLGEYVEKYTEKAVSTVKIPETRKEKIKKLFDKAYISYKEGKTSEALYYIKLILQMEDYIPAVVLKSKIFQKEGLHDRARTVLEEAYYKYPENKDILLNLARIYEEEGALVIAKDMYKILDEMGYIEGSLGYARILEKLGKKKEALNVYKKMYQNPNLTENQRKEIYKKIILLEK